MSQWNKNDAASNAINWAAQQFNLPGNTANRDALFGNTTADAIVDGKTVGLFAFDTNEVMAARAGGTPRPAHTGWSLRTEGSGGRAGRVTMETLVAMRTISGDAEDVVAPDRAIRISTQPRANTANTTAAENATFRVVAATVPTGGVLTYAWTYANGDAIATGANVGVTTTANLVVNSAVETANASYKVTISSTGATPVVSSNAVLTITT